MNTKQELNKVLSKTNPLTEAPLLSANNLRRISENGKKVFMTKVIEYSLELCNRLGKNNKNIKDIDNSKGDLSRYSGMANIISILTSIRRNIPNNYTNNDLLYSLMTLETSISILEKYTKEFKTAYSRKDSLLINIYRSTLGSLVLGVLKLSTAYAEYDMKTESIIIRDFSLNIAKDSSIISLEEIAKAEKNGSLHKLFKVSSTNGAYLGEEFLSEGLFDSHIVLESALFNEDSSGGGISSIFGIFAGIVLLVVIARKIITIYYNTRVKLADMLEETAESLYREATTSGDVNKREDKIKRADKLLELARKVDIDINNGEAISDRLSTKIDNLALKDAEKVNRDNTSLEYNSNSQQSINVFI